MKLASRTSIVLVVIVLLGQFQLVSTNALSQGDDCPSTNLIKKIGKNQFKCVGMGSLRSWIQIPSTTPAQKIIAKNLQQWSSYIGSLNLSAYVGSVELDTARTDQAALESAKNELEAKSQSLDLVTTNFVNTASNLVASANALTTSAADKKKVTDSKLSEYQTAVNKTNAYSSQYQAALSSRASSISCQILKDFGMIGSCSTNVFQDALDVQTVRNYNSLSALSDAAYADYKAAYTDWILATKLAPKELERAQLALDTSELYSARNLSLKSSLAVLIAKTNYTKSFLAQADYGNLLQDQILSEISLSSKLISSLKLAVKSNLSARYQATYLQIEYVKLLVEFQKQNLSPSPVYLGSTVTIDEPNVWMPIKYFKASNYSDLDNSSGIDIGWSWWSGSGCETYTNCKKLFVVTNKDCSQGQIALDFLTDAKVSEAKTFSKPYAFKVGEISLIEVESKFSETAKTAYFRGFKCSV